MPLANRANDIVFEVDQLKNDLSLMTNGRTYSGEAIDKKTALNIAQNVALLGGAINDQDNN